MSICLQSKVFSKASCITASVKLINGISNVIATKVDDLIVNIAVKYLNPVLNVTCSLVCSANKEKYLVVDPTIVWLTPETLSGEFNIYSNVFWKID